MALTGKQRSGVVHKVLNVLFRLGELVSAIIVLALLSRFSWLLHTGSGGSSGRVIYTMVVAALAIIFSILLIAPITALFLGFPLDFLMWIMWLIAFCLLASVGYLCLFMFMEYTLMMVERRNRALMCALAHGTIITGATIGVAGGALGRLVPCVWVTPAAVSGGVSWLFLSSP